MYQDSNYDGIANSVEGTDSFLKSERIRIPLELCNFSGFNNTAIYISLRNSLKMFSDSKGNHNFFRS